MFKLFKPKHINKFEPITIEVHIDSLIDAQYIISHPEIITNKLLETINTHIKQHKYNNLNKKL